MNPAVTPRELKRIAKNISYKGSYDYERSPESDSFESDNNRKNRNALTVLTGLTTLAALVIGGVYFHKGAKALKGTSSSFGEKSARGFEELKKDSKGLYEKIKSKIKNLFKKVNTSAEDEAVSSARFNFGETKVKTEKAPKQTTVGNSSGKNHLNQQEVRVEQPKAEVVKTEALISKEEKASAGKIKEVFTPEAREPQVAKAESLVSKEEKAAAEKVKKGFTPEVQKSQTPQAQTLTSEKESGIRYLQEAEPKQNIFKAADNEQNNIIRQTVQQQNVADSQKVVAQKLNAVQKQEPKNFKIEDYKGKTIDEIPGFRDKNGVIRHYDKNGNLVRTIRSERNGLLVITERNSEASSKKVEYLLRDGKLVKKEDNEKHLNALKNLAHELKYARRGASKRGIIDLYAGKCGMTKVNKTALIGGKRVNIIYEGFGYDITADGRILAKSFTHNGKVMAHADKTNFLAQAGNINKSWQADQTTQSRAWNENIFNNKKRHRQFEV